MHPADERFCSDCGLPLTYSEHARTDTQAPSKRQLKARKIKPQYTEGELVKVVGASNQTEGEFIQGLLLEEGIPSLLRRTRGFDVPDFLAAGPRDVLVSESAYQSAREVLLQSELIGSEPAELAMDSPWRMLAGLIVALAIIAIIIWLAQ